MPNKINHAEISEVLHSAVRSAEINRCGDYCLINISQRDSDAMKQAEIDERRIANGELVEVVRGHWEADEFGRRCSNCNEYPTDEQYENGDTTYCPSCGALMDGKDDSHETD